MHWKTGTVLLAVCLAAATAEAQPIDWNDPDAVVRAAFEANPSLAGLDAQIRAAEERVAPAGSLPNPMLMAGVQNAPINLSADFMTMYMVGASQTLVRRSRRDSLRTAAELEVERLRSQYDARKAEIERDVRTAYIEAAAAQNQIAATEEIARVLTSVIDSSRIRYESGAVPQTDLIRAMLEESTIDHQLLLLRRQRRSALARLLPLLRLGGNTQVPAFSLQHEMSHRPAATGDATLPELTPALAERQAEVSQAGQQLRMARLAAKPDVSIEASYGFRPGDIDMFSVVARIELPLRRGTLIEPRIREARARQEAALRQVDAMRQQLQEDLGAAIALRDEAVDQIVLHVDTLVPTAKLGFESALVSYQNGMTTFDAVLGLLRAYVSLNVDYYDFLRQQLEAEADIDAIRRGARSGIAGAGGMTASPRSSSTPDASATSMQ
ncbi:MAG: outer membrane protein heavy metal efflux system [Acidobacteriota bacterium]|jgi:outer membrane protein TolC|nr:outer membrane protein heavy metal efflux system [Acidobacteriota bacterium]